MFVGTDRQQSWYYIGTSHDPSVFMIGRLAQLNWSIGATGRSAGATFQAGAPLFKSLVASHVLEARALEYSLASQPESSALSVVYDLLEKCMFVDSTAKSTDACCSRQVIDSE